MSSNARARPQVSVWPRSREPEALKAWIKEVCAALSISPTKLASNAEVAHTTISRFLSGKSINKNISPSTIGAISTVIVEAVERGDVLIREDPYSHIVLRSQAKAEEYMEEAKAKLTFSGLVLKSVDIIGHVGKGIIQSGRREIMWKDAQLSILVPPELMFSFVFGLEMREQENKYFRVGDILICTTEFIVLPPFRAGLFVVLSQEVEADKFENKLYLLKADPQEKLWLIPTWRSSSSKDQVYIGDQSEEAWLSLEADAIAVVSSLKGQLPLEML